MAQEDQKAAYRKRVLQAVIERSGLLRDLAALVMQYASCHFCPLGDVEIKVGHPIDVRMVDSEKYFASGAWIAGIIERQGEERVSVRHRRWLDSTETYLSDIPLHETRIRPYGWITQGPKPGTNPFPDGHPVWVWDRWIREWTRGVVERGTNENRFLPGWQWRVRFERDNFRMIALSSKKGAKTFKRRLPRAFPTSFCAGEICDGIVPSLFPPLFPLTPEEGEVYVIRDAPQKSLWTDSESDEQDTLDNAID